MARRKIPADTRSFRYTDLNPSGARSNDCVVRALALAMGRSWEETFDALCAIAREKGRMPNDRHVYEAYLKSAGWEKQKQPTYPNGRKYTVRDLAALLAGAFPGAAIPVTMAGHMSVMKDGQVLDTWDCGHKCVSNYWIKA